MKTKTAKTEYPPTPELDKMLALREEPQKIGAFLEWLQEDYTVAQYGVESDELHPAHLSIEKLLANYFGIDLNKIEDERRAVLNWHRKNNS